jgi:uncharacterized protein YcfL
MSAVVRRTFFAFVLVLILLTTGAWQSEHVALAGSQTAGPVDAPLYLELTWPEPVLSTQEIRINSQGDSISLSGERYEAVEQFKAGVPQEVSEYYSNEQLAKSGWFSYDAFNRPDGVHFVYYHDSGVYLSVEFLTCPDDASSTCIAVWKSEQVRSVDIAPDITSQPDNAAAGGDFGKIAPRNGDTGLDPTGTTLSWEAYPNADKYKYCVKEGSACDEDDPAWMSTYSRSLTLRNLSYNKTYYWQVKATTCELCVPKDWVYADDDTAWYFKTKPGTGNQVTILGNVGVGGAVLSFTDGTAKQVTADSTGAYSLKVSYNWSGTITPSKAGYAFTPASASFTNLTATQTIQNFLATAIYVISGNTGMPGVTLSYVNGTPQTVVSDASGNYSLVIPAGWSGTVTPSKTGYVFSPASRTYSNLSANQTAQNYTPAVATYTISGNAGVAGVALKYINGTPRAVLTDGSGNYSITVPFGWSGTVTPSKTGYMFSPVSQTYSNVAANQAAQNYTAIPIYSISGNTGAAGVTLSYTDVTSKTVTSLADGSYSFTVPGGWSGTVTPTHACFTFNPASQNYSNLASNQTNQNFTPALKAGCADVNVEISGDDQGRFGLPSQGSTRASFNKLNDGPVKVAITSASSLIAAERVIYKVDGVNTSFAETMGLPNGQVEKIYWLPWYNNLSLDTQLRIANVSGAPATVTVTIGGEEQAPINLAIGESTRVSYDDVNAGPVMIESTQNIVAAERVIYKVNNINTSFSEMMALPNSQLDTTYWLPWYNNVGLDTQLRIANVTTQDAKVTVTIGGEEQTPFDLPAGTSIQVSYPANAGPVRIVGTQDIVVAARAIYKVNNIATSFAEMMALPNSQLDTIYWLPWYNNLSLDTQLRFGRP